MTTREPLTLEALERRLEEFYKDLPKVVCPACKREVYPMHFDSFGLDERTLVRIPRCVSDRRKGVEVR